MYDVFTSYISSSQPTIIWNWNWLLLFVPAAFAHARFGVYVPLCCFHQEGGKSQTAPTDCDYPADHQQTDLTETPFFRPRDFLFLLRENLREQFSSPPHMPIHTCPPHTHSHTPELIRAEVEELKSDFNRRIKEVLFNSLFSAYYVAFLPLCFVKVGICPHFWLFIILRHISLWSLLPVLTTCLLFFILEHSVLWHALVMWASDHGLDQCFCNAHEPAVAPQLLRPAPSLSGSPGPLAETGARLV